MQESIKRILDGNFEYESGSLDFSCTKIELRLLKGSMYEGSFHIFSAPGCFTEGCVTSSDVRMECLTPEFVGNDAEIAFCFHGESMEEGDVLKGAFSVVSNRGEHYLPFVVTIEHTILDSSVGPVKNLFHFANLAKTNWQEALDLFYSPGFVRVFTGSDEQLLSCYRALSVNPGHEQNMEEFLIQINKKYPVEFVTQQTQLTLELPAEKNPYAVAETELEIVRNGWGYTALRIECEGGFVFTEKEYLSEDDFLGNYCRLPVYVDSSLCHKGKNFGTVFLYNSYVSLEIPVMVRLGEPEAGKHLHRNYKRIVVQLREFYQAFRLKKISTETWLKETGKLVDRLVSMDQNDVAANLFRAQVLITDGRLNEAGWVLDRAVELMELKDREKNVLWAYYLYLTSLVNKDEKHSNHVATEVERIYRKNRHEWRLAWLLLYLSEEYNKSATGKWVLLEKQFQYGCMSPVLYIEALYLINNNPSILRKLEKFELQVLYYGAKQQALSPETIEQLLYLVEKVKEPGPVLEKLLMMLYEKQPDARILHQICILLIKEARTGRDCFIWYRRGIEAQLRITNLYEYYMMSLDTGQVQALPKIVLMYFAYQNNLDYERSAFLYAHLLLHKEDYGDLYNGYRNRIEKFALAQLQKEHMNRHLAVIYGEVLKPEMITEQLAYPLSRLVFAHEIRVEDQRMKKVYVYQPGSLKPLEYYLSNGVAWISLFGSDNIIVFEDAYGNRFLKNVEYTLEKLMVPGKYLKSLAQYVKDLPPLDVYLCRGEKYENEITGEVLERYKRIMKSPFVEAEFRCKAYMKLLQYFYEADDMAALDGHLEQMPPEELTEEERASVVRFMVLRGKYETVYEWIKMYSPYFVEPKILLRFTSDMIQQKQYEKDDILFATALYAFRRGKHDSVTVQYLCDWYEGLSKELRDIWKAARNYGIDCTAFSERLLVQMLYSGAFVGERLEIFRYYVSGNPESEVVDAVLAQCAYEYFVKDKLMEEYICREIARIYLSGLQVQWVCKLAFLKYYSEHRDLLTESIKPVAGAFLQEMMKQQVHLNFFREYKEFEYLLEDMRDKTIIEYKLRPGAHARIQYMILRENGEEEEYVTEYMQEVYAGVCSMEFVLFFGEILQYYIVEEDGETEQLTESGSIQKSDSIKDSVGSKYELINDMAIKSEGKEAMTDYETV